MKRLYFIFFALLLFSCSINKAWLRPGILNSTRIEEKFGSYGVDVMVNDEQMGVRLANLYSKLHEQKVMRTLALVKFVPNIDESLKKAHQEILNGASLGSTLVKHKALVKKKLIYKDKIFNLPKKIYEMMNIYEGPLPVIIYDLVANIDGRDIEYCTITEVYSPLFLSFSELNTISNQMPYEAFPQKAQENIKILNNILEK